MEPLESVKENFPSLEPIQEAMMGAQLSWEHSAGHHKTPLPGNNLHLLQIHVSQGTTPHHRLNMRPDKLPTHGIGFSHYIQKSITESEQFSLSTDFLSRGFAHTRDSV